MDQLKIAVVGAGISGLAAAWLLSRRHAVTLFEADRRPGGHANTVDVDTADASVPVDTGFIVYNENNYPNLTALFARLGVATTPTQMSFALSAGGGAYEYSGSGLGGFLGQPSNALSPRHWRLAADISRFFRTALSDAADLPPGLGLGAYLAGRRYSRAFIDNHIVPMGAAIWSSDPRRMLDFPARSFIDFYGNHGMLQLRDRPAWRSLADGSRSYVEALIADGSFELRTSTPVRRIVRTERYAAVVEAAGSIRPFDAVVLATHADQALAMIDAPDELEADVLGAFSYQENMAVLHTDARFMPARRRLWSAWNYLRRGMDAADPLCVTYWMNRLQSLATGTDIFVTLNPYDDIHPKAERRRISYRHPVFTADAVAAQARLPALQGRRRTWFCGSYAGYGFHEDGLEAGLAVAEELGGLARPWAVAPGASRIRRARLAEAAE